MSDNLKIEWLEEFTARLKNLKVSTIRVPLSVLQEIFAEVFAHHPGIALKRSAANISS
jgi:hypothetical protein